jgi:hypothetical protein
VPQRAADGAGDVWVEILGDLVDLAHDLVQGRARLLPEAPDVLPEALRDVSDAFVHL